jgi:hypothetical protein
MKITGLQNIANLLGGGNSQLMNFTPSQNVRQKLTVGEVVSATIGEYLGDNKYAMKMLGENLVVHSDQPLKAREMIQGRVIGIGDKVELQRLANNKAQADQQGIESRNWQYLQSQGKAGMQAAQMLQDHLVTLTENEQQLLLKVLTSASEKEAMILSAVVLKKLELPLTQEFLTSIYPVMTARNAQRLHLSPQLAQLGFEKADTLQQQDDMKPLANFLARVIGELPEQDLAAPMVPQDLTDTGGQMSGDFHQRDQSAQHDPRRMLLNAQSDNTVAHRVTVVPFLVNDQLIEVDVALFSQKQNVNIQGIKHRRIVIGLTTDTLGKVEVEIILSNSHAHLQINTASPSATQQLEKYMPNLSRSLQAHQINVDGIAYGVVHHDAMNNVISSVMEHYITQDSVNRAY